MIAKKGLLKHIRCGIGDIAPYVIIPGDSGRVERIAAQMDTAILIAKNRDYITYTGKYHGVPITVCSSGIGGPSASIAIEELIKLGAKIFIRVGSAGGRQSNIQIGTPVVITATYRGDGTSKAYLPPEFPAVASLDVTNALIEALDKESCPYDYGLGFCRDAYYVQDSELNKLLKNCGVKVAEQESSILFILGAFRRIKTGAIVSTDSNIYLENQPTLEQKDKLYLLGEKKTILAALGACEILYKKDAHIF